MKRQTVGLLAALLLVSSAACAAEKAVAVPKYKFDKIAHLSCKQAWQQADKSVNHAFGMIETMAAYLLKQRQQVFPNEREAGEKFGKSIDARCKADPDQLMLNAVDAALRELVQP